MNLTLVTPSSATPVQVDASIEALIDRFARDQDVVESSRELYMRTLRLFMNWLQNKRYVLSQVDRSIIIQYKEEGLAKGLSGLTVGSYLTTVRKFYEWAEANKLYPNVARGVKSPKRKRHFRRQPLTAQQGKDLLTSTSPLSENAEQVVVTGQELLMILRDHAIANLLLRTGLRTIELIRANVGDITMKAGKRVLKIQGKGRDEKDDFVILTDKAYKPIATYLKQRISMTTHKARQRLDLLAPLFVSHSNNNRDGRLTTRTIRQMAKEQLRGIGIDSPEYTAHSFRHSTAVNILLNGGTIEEAQGVLRHASPATTQIYTYTVQEQMRLTRATEERLDDVF
ncbi:tyrosine-type recombinase/integrase [Fibrella sp. HMF5335]|uniref:Tyrosine-type recombinase/integrase n=1 Tax=Fibrella rubiginis TaxID=2817060 RepID=A0A939K0U2_9BACT|nr:tyrosine-type recombinase/integrase [Fibrella rubiginis]MBO0936457.1 tyrosine-type recombinase/integrase [Fibrella rubiginis]